MVHKGETMNTGEVWQWGDPDGDKPEHYEDGRYELAKAVLLGLADGVREASKNAKRIINTGGWLHYGFIQRLIDDKVQFEILGWHWYSDMGDITNVRGNFNLWGHLTSFGKPIWITEINRRNGSINENEEEQANYIKEVASQIRNLKEIKAFFVYELLDELYFGKDNPESYYGFVKLKKNEENLWVVGEKKQAFDTTVR